MRRREEVDMKGRELQSLLGQFSCFITHTPLSDEAPCPALPDVAIYTIEARASLDPIKEAASAGKLAGELPTAVLIPGRRFDPQGARHGRGGGWYDRFLAEVPDSWTRIGLCYDEQLASEPLTRQAWDEPMDYLIVIPKPGGAPLLYETRARA